MKLRRIYAVFLRYWFYLIHSYDRLSDMFYWPLVDLILFGVTSKFYQAGTNSTNIIFIVISGVLFWLVVWRAQYEITVNFLSELWDRNLVNLFVSPLKVSEWIVSVFFIGFIKMVISLTFASTLAFVLYKIQFLNYGWYLFPFIFSLILTGWAIGSLITGIIVRYGTKIQTIAWTAVMLISPFSAIYYPLKVLPEWAQAVAKFIPSSYIFENARNLIINGRVNWTEILISFFLNIIYLIISVFFLIKSFKKARNRGFIKLD